jgi:proteasome accessory factor A
MSEYTTYLKVGVMAVLLRMVEDPGYVLPDMSLENPIRAIREISHDLDLARKVRLANGREATALQIQQEYLARALRYEAIHGFPEDEVKALRMWEHVLTQLESDPFKLDRELDWVIKHNLIEAYRTKHALALSHPKVALIDLQYHDIRRESGVFYRLQNRGMVERTLEDGEMFDAIDQPPQTTRAKLRGDFIRRAKEKKRDYTVDWVHLKLNDQAQRTVLCKDPFKSEDDRVAKLIASL